MDTSASNPDSVKQGYLFELPVQKWSRTERAFKNRVLALTKSSVVEMDVVTRFVTILLLLNLAILLVPGIYVRTAFFTKMLKLNLTW